MFGALERYFTGKAADRKHKRLEKPFNVLYSTDNGATWVPGFGLDMSMGGLRAILKGELPGMAETPMRVYLDEFTLEIRVHPVWHRPRRYKDRIAHEYGMQFAAAGAVDRERIERWLAGKPLEEENLAQDELNEIRLKPDDVDRLIPVAFQQRLLQELVARGRLAPLDPGRPPLVAYDYGGVRNTRGKPMHRLTIESKVNRDDETVDRYATRFLFDESGEIEVYDAKPRQQPAAVNGSSSISTSPA